MRKGTPGGYYRGGKHVIRLKMGVHMLLQEANNTLILFDVMSSNQFILNTQ